MADREGFAGPLPEQPLVRIPRQRQRELDFQILWFWREGVMDGRLGVMAALARTQQGLGRKDL